MNARKLTVSILMGIFIVFNLYGAACAQGRQQGPPPEAYSACDGKSEGDTASFESPRGDTITGTCTKGKNGDRLVLHPDNPPPDRDKSDNKND